MTLPVLPALSEALRVLGETPVRVEDARAAGSAALLEWVRLAGELKRVADAQVAAVAGEVARRSAPGSGWNGFARQAGARTPEELLQTHAGMTGRDAATAVRVGRLTQGGLFADGGGVAQGEGLAQGEGFAPEDGVTRAEGSAPGHEPGAGLERVGSRVLDGSVSVPAAEAIRAGLSGTTIEPRLLDEAAALLCDEAQRLDPDKLLKRAREVRDELDEAGIADREAVLRSRRSIKRIDLRDGMKRIIWDYDPETAGVVDEIYDRATSPRRGGPRFVDATQAARAESIENDSRSIEQLASDAFAELLRQAATLDDTVLLGSGTPAVRVIVPVEALESGRGHGVIEGSSEALSMPTVERLVCAAGAQPVVLDASGRALDLGREQRLYSRRQRVALAVRDGGCLWPGCDRPPSWTEAHHIDPWSRGGRTDVDRGVLLCRHHHLRLHNEKCTIRLRAGKYWLETPPGSGRDAVMLETKSRAIREHVRRRSDAARPQSPDPERSGSSPPESRPPESAPADSRSAGGGTTSSEVLLAI